MDFKADDVYFKQASLLVTLVFLLPLIFVMCIRLKRSNLIFYLGITNFIVFNFGFHVHEKAILMTLVPMMLDCHENSSAWDKTRLIVLKTIGIWTFLPLIVSHRETMVKHTLFLVDVIITQAVFLKLDMKQVKWY